MSDRMHRVIRFPVSAAARARLRRNERRSRMAQALAAAGEPPLTPLQIVAICWRTAPDMRGADVIAATRAARSSQELRRLRRHIRRPRR
jgi:hypothetical protein